jgi:hypothetical protein
MIHRYLLTLRPVLNPLDSAEVHGELQRKIIGKAPMMLIHLASSAAGGVQRFIGELVAGLRRYRAGGILKRRH